MADDVTKNINYNYKTNVETMTMKHRGLANSLGQVTTRTEIWQKTIGKNDRELIGYKETVKQTSKKLSGFTNRTLLATSGTKKLTSGMGGLALRFVGYQMVLGQVMALQQKFVDFLKESVKAFREFETRLAEVSTILGSDQIPLMARLQAGIENLSLAYGQATSDMSKGMYDILSAAFDAEDAINLLTTSTKASIAGLSDIRTSVDIFTTVLNTYGMQVEQATSVSNTLFQSVVRGKFQFQDLEQALGYVVPIAAQAGIAFEELMAALSTTTRHGLHLDMTSRGLALAIQGIVTPSAKATKAAEKYGIEMNGLALRVMGLHGWFEKLNEATKEYGTSILGELIPNMRSLRVAMVLAGDVGLAGFNDDLRELAQMGNATEIALKKIMNTSQFVSNQLSQQWEQVKRDVGEDWDAIALGVQRAIIGVTKYMQQRGRISQMPKESDYTFVKDDALHNATEYLKIADKITALEKERELLPDDPPEPGALENIVRFVFEPFVLPTAKTSVKDINEDIAALIETQEKFTDSFNEVAGGILTEVDTLGDLELTLDNVELAIRGLSDELLKTFVYGFKDASGVMKEASVNVSDLTTLTQEQRDALRELGSTIKGNLAYQYMSLHAQREYADATHDVSTGLKITGYLYKEIPGDIQAAVKAVREYTEAQDDNREATQRMTAAMRTYQIQLLELQLKGMMRRRGLTRMEEKQIKKIQIKQAQARLDNMNSQKKMLESDVITNQESKQLIDDYLLKVKEKQYELKYTYDQQIIDLETAISREGEKLQTRYNWWETTNQKIIDNSEDLITTLNKIMEEPIFVDMLSDYGLEVDALKIKIQELMDTASGRTNTYVKPPKDTDTDTDAMTITTVTHPWNYDMPDSKPVETQKEIEGTRTSYMITPYQYLMRALASIDPSGRITRYKDGIDYVPKTGPAIVHRGERIIPAGSSQGGGDNITIYNTIHATINNDMDVEKLAAKLSQAENNQLLDKGKTKFRMRIG